MIFEDYFLFNYRVEGDVCIIVVDKEVNNPYKGEDLCVRVKLFLSTVCRGEIKAELINKRYTDVYFGLERVFDMPSDVDPTVVFNQKITQVSSHIIEQPVRSDPRIPVSNDDTKFIAFQSDFDSSIDRF